MLSSSRRSSLAVHLVTVALMSAMAGCRGTATPTPPPTRPAATVEPLPSDTNTPTVTPTFTPSVTPIPSPTPTPVFGAARPDQPEPGCEIPLKAETWALAPVADAPDDAQADWAARATRSLTAEVLEHATHSRAYLLRAVDPPVEFSFYLDYAGEPMPIAIGQRYRFTAHHDVRGQPPAGSALRIEDDNGVLFLGVSVRETDGAAERLLNGDRAGFSIRRQPTRCLFAPIDACGYELRAAPLEIRRGDATLTLNAGEDGLLEGDPPYRVTIHASHYRLWARSAICEDPTDWILSYRIVRSSP